MNAEDFSLVANDILRRVGLGEAGGFFLAEVAWQAHQRANDRSVAGTVLHDLLDLEERCGPHSVESAVVQTIVNCGPIHLEAYPIAAEVWRRLGFEVYQNGDGSHGAHIPMVLRQALH